MGKRLDKLKSKIKSALMRVSIPLMAAFNISATSALPVLPDGQLKKDSKTKEFVADAAKGSEFSFSAECLDEDKIIGQLTDEGFTLADVLGSGLLQKEELKEINYSLDDYASMSNSPLSDQLLKNLQKKAVPSSKGLCAQAVREGWDITTKGAKGKTIGRNGQLQIEEENLWNSGTGEAKTWPIVIEERSKLLLCVGTANQDGSGNIPFESLQQVRGGVMVAPGVGAEAGHAWSPDYGKQASDFYNDAGWIQDKMNKNIYAKKIICFVAADAEAPKIVMQKVFENARAQGLSAQEVCNKLKVDYNNDLLSVEKVRDAVSPWHNADPLEKIEKLYARLGHKQQGEKKDVEKTTETKNAETSIKTNLRDGGRV